MVDIRAAGAAEANLIATLSRQTFKEAFAAFNTEADMELFLTTQFTIEMLEAETQSLESQFFIAWINDQPVGYMKLKKHLNGHINIKPWQPSLEICRIYVIKDFIGKGIGQKMIDYTVDLARKGGFFTICLGVWEENKNAIRFYQKNGFKQVGQHKFLLGTDNQTDWLMSRKV